MTEVANIDGRFWLFFFFWLRSYELGILQFPGETVSLLPSLMISIELFLQGYACELACST
jgi:hypothetical protein